MGLHFIILLSISLFTSLASADWKLISSKVEYDVRHPLHRVLGVSTDSRGKGVCTKSKCQFLVATELKSFSSDNSNRDQHVLETVGAAKNPIVKIHFEIQNIDSPSPLDANASIELNGEKVQQTIKIAIAKKTYDKISSQTSATGHFTLFMTSFKIEPPSLLAVATNDKFEVNFSSVWEQSVDQSLIKEKEKTDISISKNKIYTRPNQYNILQLTL